MVDQKAEEQASLYVLDLLEVHEKRAFEIRRREDPELERMVRELQVDLEGLALAVGPAAPGPRVFERIIEEVEGKPKTTLFFGWVRLGLPLAACLALGWLIATLTIPRNYRTHPQAPGTAEPRSDTALTNPSVTQKTKGPATMDGASGTNAVQALLAAQKKELQRLDDAYHKEQARNQALAGRVNDLSRRTAFMEARIREYTQGQPGLKRLTIIDLGDPKNRASGPSLAEDAGRILATDASSRLGFSTGQTTNHDGGANPSIDSSKTTLPILVDAGAGRNLPPATFGQNAALAPNAASNGQAASETPATSTGTNLNNAAKQTEAAAGPPQAVAIVDQTSQIGTLIVQGLPPLADNHVYQFWATDPQYAQPVTVGFLPILVSGGGQFSFSLPGMNLVPTRFTVTLEPSSGSPAPTGPVILDGPP